MRNPPPRNYRLALWHLLYGVPVESAVIPAVELQAVEHCRYRGGWEQWISDKARWRKQYDRMLRKRAARLEYYQRHGSIRDGWTPPIDDQNNRRPMHRIRLRMGKKARKSPFARLMA